MTRPDRKQVEAYARDFLLFADSLTIPGANGPAPFGEIMAPFQRDRFESIAPALQAVASGRKPAIARHWWEATKGGSKDSDLAVCLLWLLTFNVRSRPIHAQIAAGDRDQADELRKAAKDLLRLNPWLSSAVDIQASRIVNRQCANEGEVIPADVAGSHGARPDVVIANELSHVGKREFVENLFDNLTKVPYGLGIVATNAGFNPSWQFTWREHARQSADWAFHKWDRPAPWLSEKQVAEAKVRNSTNRFARLWLGQWMAPGGNSLPEAWITRAVVHDGPLDRRDPNKYHGAGVGIDLGLANHHAAVVATVSDYFGGKIRVAAVWDFRPPVRIADVEAAIMEARERFGARFVVTDPWQAVDLSQRLQAKGFAVVLEHPTTANLGKQAAVLLETLRNEQLGLFDHPLLLKDLRSTAVIDRAVADVTRGYRLEWPEDEDGHADRASALCNILPYSLEALSIPPVDAAPAVMTLPSGARIEVPNVVSGADISRLMDMDHEMQARMNAIRYG